MCVCVRENIAAISGRRVSGYAQRVITLSWQTFLPLLQFLFACVHAVLLFPPPLSPFVFSFAGLVPTPSSSYSNSAPPCDVHFYSLARLQGRRNTIRPARKWRNYIREQEGEEGRVNHDGEEATGRARLRRGVSHPPKTRFEKGFREPFSFLPRNQEKMKSLRTLGERYVLPRDTFLLFERIVFRSSCYSHLRTFV